MMTQLSEKPSNFARTSLPERKPLMVLDGMIRGDIDHLLNVSPRIMAIQLTVFYM